MFRLAPDVAAENSAQRKAMVLGDGIRRICAQIPREPAPTPAGRARALHHQKIENASIFTSVRKLKQERDEIQAMIEKLNFKRKNLKPKLSDKEMVEIKRRVQEEISMYSVNSILQGWTTNIRS